MELKHVQVFYRPGIYTSKIRNTGGHCAIFYLTKRNVFESMYMNKIKDKYRIAYIC